MIKLILIFMIISSSWASERVKVDPLSFGNVRLGEERLPLRTNFFDIKMTGELKVEASLVEHTFQWVRLDEALLVPRALLKISISSETPESYSISYGGQTFIPLFDANSKKIHTSLFISLFEALPLQIMSGDQVLHTIRVTPRTQMGESKRQLIDYSCAPYHLELKGLESDYVSVGCKIQRTGKFGDETPYLEVIFTTASHRLKNKSDPPYRIIFNQSGEAVSSMINDEAREESFSISATTPTHLPRLKLAMGVGPYSLYAKSSGEKKRLVAPTLMLYGNLSLNDASSLRFFDSYSKIESTTFHNWGTYFAWDLARFCDQRCQLTSLIGMQGVGYSFTSNERTHSDVIYPQGFEFVYSHPFGLLNYKLSYGMFTSLSGLYDYQNIWLRFGKKIFWEINYIDWKKGEQSASMYGLSVGFPLASFF
ncbi:MAG: hypothetical protein K2P81_10350 [Bacteriovoracaceae bacterium]|nr:hypothetical protein [Bacteriovoracaceae bacterium]